MITVSYPKFELTLPSNGEKVTFRPFLMREEKILLFASESGEEREIVNAIDTVVQECTFNSVSNSTHPFFDVQYVYLQIRAKSVGETAEFVLSCGECGHKTESNLDLDKLQILKQEDHTPRLTLSEDTGVLMKYPKLEALAQVSQLDSVESVYEVIISCLDMIYSGDEVYVCKDHTKEELVEFLDNLTQDQFEKITNFFETMPRIESSIEFTCSKCDKINVADLDGILNFFG